VAALKCHTAYEPHPRVAELPGAPAITRSWPDPEALAQLRADVRALRPRVDTLVTYFHWGVSGMEELAEYQQLVAHDVIDHGADLVIGSHAHVPQATEVYQDRVILYGLGNFAFDWTSMGGHRTGLVATCTLAGGRLDRVSVRAVPSTSPNSSAPTTRTGARSSVASGASRRRWAPP
jgi:poly-gamma-glutamate synthesis protein (capsule biosynthesis protein)